MVTSLRARTYRAIASRYPRVSIYDRVADPRDLDAIVELEALTNPRARMEAGDLRKIRPRDRISGPGSTPVMASFAYSGPSRFGDGSYGLYYAGLEEETALAESIFHAERFLAATAEPPLEVDRRLYVARMAGEFDDLRKRPRGSPLYDPNSYAASQQYGRVLYEDNVVDGIVYRSVRRSGGECAVAFRPRLVRGCRATKEFRFSWDGRRISAVTQLLRVS
jgi:hypothetical protein